MPPVTVSIATIASIPSPSFNTIDIWPRPLTLYGLMIGLGIIAATVMARCNYSKNQQLAASNLKSRHIMAFKLVCCHRPEPGSNLATRL